MQDETLKAAGIFRLSEPRAKNLLVVCRGPGAVEIPREQDKWDLLEIFFVPSEIETVRQNPTLSQADHVVFESDRQWRKFRIMKRVLQATPFWRAYHSIMFADDDLIPVDCTVADIFDLFAATGCRIGQPALTQDSYFFHMMTVKNNNFIWRKTNFVEVMCPIMTQAAIDDYLPQFDATVTNFGLDYYWSYHEWRAGRGAAMLDRTPVKHCRPVGGGTAHQGLNDPHQEYMDFMAKHEIPLGYAHLCLDGVSDPRLTEQNRMLDILRLGLAVSGYDRKFNSDLNFLGYIANEIEAARKKSA